MEFRASGMLGKLSPTELNSPSSTSTFCILAWEKRAAIGPAHSVLYTSRSLQVLSQIHWHFHSENDWSLEVREGSNPQDSLCSPRLTDMAGALELIAFPSGRQHLPPFLPEGRLHSDEKCFWDRWRIDGTRLTPLWLSSILYQWSSPGFPRWESGERFIFSLVSY